MIKNTPVIKEAQNRAQLEKPSAMWLIMVMTLLSMIGPFSIDTYLPAFPSIEAEYDITRDLLSQSLGSYLAAFAIATLFWGPITDRFGRKKVIFGGMVCYLLASLGCALASDYSEFLGYRTIQGIAASAGLVAGRAMVRDIFDSREAQRIMSYVMMFFAFAPALAPLIGAELHDAFGWRSIFYFLAIYGGIATTFALLIIYETLPIEQRQSLHPFKVVGVYLKALTNFRFLSIVIAGGASFGGLFLFIAGSPTILFNFLGLGVSDFWVQFVPMVLGLVIGSFFTGRMSHSHSSETIISIAIAAMTIATIANLFQAYYLQATIVSVIAPLVLYAFGIGMSLPAFTVMALDCFPKNRGSASAVQAFVQMMSNAIVASIVLPLVNESLIAFAIAQLGFILLSIIFWIKIAISSK